MKKYILLIIAITVISVVQAQTLTVSAPSNVDVGEQFRLTYTVNTQDVKDFRAGKMPDAFEVLIGPNRSTQSSFQIINGHTSSTSSVTYTYILKANRSGLFSIPSAQVTTNDTTIISNGVTIKVQGKAEDERESQQGNLQTSNEEIRDAGSQISDSDVFFKVSASKTHVLEQQAILLTYKVYTIVSLTNLKGKSPDIKNCIIHELPQPEQKSFVVEQYDGKPYKTVVWSQYVLFPQVSGLIQIPSITFEGTIVKKNRNIDPFEAFFNGGNVYVEEKRQIIAPSIDLVVDPLPQRPANFSGGVGKFSITSEVNKKDANFEVGDTVIIRCIVSGIGNLSIVDMPIVNLPKEFKKVDVDATEQIGAPSEKGEEGKVCYDIKIVPLYGGKYEIPAPEFTYFDIQSKSYKTVKGKPMTVHVVGEPVNPSSLHESEESERNLSISSILQNHWKLILCAAIFALVYLIYSQWSTRRKDKETKKSEELLNTSKHDNKMPTLRK